MNAGVYNDINVSNKRLNVAKSDALDVTSFPQYQLTGKEELDKYLVGCVRNIGGEAYKFVSPGNAGVPDRIVIMPGGGVWFVELKCHNKKLRPLQRSQHLKLLDFGITTHVLDSREGIDDFVHYVLQEHPLE